MLPQQQLPIPYIVPPHLEEYNIPLSAFAAARPQFHNIVGGAFIFSTTVPDAVTSITTAASAPTSTKGAAPGTTAPTFSSPSASTPPPVSASSSPFSSPRSSTAAAQSPQTPTSYSSTTSTPATTPGTTPDDHLHPLSPDDDDDAHEVPEPEPKTLLLQRSIIDSYPCHWENPGGLIDPVRDATVLAGVAREVREETGFHVSRFVDLVCVDEWTKMKRGVLLQETKVTFLVEVREQAAAGWEGRVKLAEGSIRPLCGWARGRCVG